MKVLIPTNDHGYREATVRITKVVYNKRYRSYTEYFGDDFLEEGDEVIEMQVVE